MSSLDTSPPPAAEPSPHAAPPPEPSLRKRAVHGSLWTAVGYGSSQVLRFGANLLLTRLLFPDAFGTMVLVNTFIMGLHLFSDVGIVPSIVQNKRGDEPRFLDTAWTIQVVRGVILWLGACALAYPFAMFYAGAPTATYGPAALATFICVASTTAVIDGLCSTKLYTLRRHVQVGKLVAIEFVTQLVATVVMIAWALAMPTIWALVGGSIAGEIFRTVASHRLPGRRNRLRWDPAIGRELFRFGKWIFLGTLLTFVAEQSDRLIFGKLISVEQLGVYHIALMLALIVPLAIEKIGETVFFPSFSRMLDGATDFRPGFRSARTVLSTLGGYVVAGMIAAGPPVVAVLYDERYGNAGWMLQLLAIVAWFSILECSTGAALLALGRVRLRAAAHLSKVVGIVTLIPLGHILYGFPGALVGLALAQVAKYAVATLGARAAGLPTMAGDLALSAWVAISGLGVLAGVTALGDLPAVGRAAAAIAATTLAWLPCGLALWRRHRDTMRA